MALTIERLFSYFPGFWSRPNDNKLDNGRVRAHVLCRWLRFPIVSLACSKAANIHVVVDMKLKIKYSNGLYDPFRKATMISTSRKVIYWLQLTTVWLSGAPRLKNSLLRQYTHYVRYILLYIIKRITDLKEMYLVNIYTRVGILKLNTVLCK